MVMTSLRRLISRSLAGSTGRLLVAATLAAPAGVAGPASAHRSYAPAPEVLDVPDEPGRVSTEESVIADGPVARQMVFFRSREPRGTLVVHTAERFVYWVQENNRALRYGIGVGRE